MKYKLTIETPDDVLTIQCSNIESVKRFADCVAGFISPECNQDASDGDDWIDWNGGACPLSDDDYFDFIMRDGYGCFNNRYASTLQWEHTFSNGDIIAYRLHKPKVGPHPHDMGETTFPIKLPPLKFVRRVNQEHGDIFIFQEITDKQYQSNEHATESPE